MLGTIINAGLILLGSIIGLLFKNHIGERFTKTITQGLAVGMKSCMAPLVVLGVAVLLYMRRYFSKKAV